MIEYANPGFLLGCAIIFLFLSVIATIVDGKRFRKTLNNIGNLSNLGTRAEQDEPKASAAYRQFRDGIIAAERAEQLAKLEAEVFAPIEIESTLNDPHWTNLPSRKESR